jgi:ubiquinone/menaquinone biosynthesis C-methylase UbiE
MKKIIKKNDGSVPVEDVLCTTYQMRNFYLQLRDGFFTDLDIMNYIQHYRAVKMMKAGDTILDLCCGRGLLLPLMRYHAKEVGKYIGVDIEPKNIESSWKDIRTGNKIDPETFFPFKIEWVIANASDFSRLISDRIDFLVYTSSIEHMQKEDGEKSLGECAKVIRPGGILFLSCPNTPEDQDGFDVQYKAHVYEWKISELEKALLESGFQVEKKLGLIGSIRDFKKILESLPRQIASFFTPILDYVPGEFLKPILFLGMPGMANEVLMICRKR